MRVPYLFVLFMVFSLHSKSQFFDLDGGKTHAIVIGVSDYIEDSIPHLQFAHKDAQIFADYLQSEAGGNVPSDQIILLLNENATQAKIYQAWRKILRDAKKNDQVVFYFAGHGDVENETVFQLGYLLAHDTPFNNYMNNALSVDHLNIFAKTLSDREAKTVFFLDACRSGKLAGSNIDGPSITFKNLSVPAGSEVRVMSCKSDQKSLEISTLGDGRGLFSFFLVNGLTGKADGIADDNFNKQVSLEELGIYIKKNVRKVAAKFDRKQEPVIEGIDEFMLAKIDTQALAALAADPNVDELLLGNPIVTTAGIDRPDSNSVSSAPQNAEAPETFNTETSDIKGQEPVSGFGTQTEKTPFESRLLAGNLLEPKGSSAYDLLLKRIKNRPRGPLAREMKDKLIIALQEQAQRAINSYLRGDQNELNRRVFIEKAKIYKKYPQYLAKAAELIGEDDIAYDDIQAKRYYFEGINARLDASADTPMTESEVDKCIDLQNKALAHTPNAAYIHNELGVLKIKINDLAGARTSFEKAIELSPTWAIPQANLGAVDIAENKLDEAIGDTKKALTLQKDYLAAYTNLSNIYQQKKDFLNAEHYAREAIKQHWDHYSGFRMLATVYSQMGNFELSDHMWKETIIRMIGVFPQIMAEPMADLMSLNQVAEDVSPLTEQELLARIAANPLDDEAWYLLGKLYVREDRKEEAEECFLEVVDIRKEPLDVYNDLGDLYNNWNRSEDAIAVYRKYMKQDDKLNQNFNTEIALKTWTTLERLERNDESEALIGHYMSRDSFGGTQELYDFYGRMVFAYPKNDNYWYKRGLLLYNHNNRGFRFQTNKPILKNENFHHDFWEASVIFDFEEALSLNPEYPSRADIYLKNAELYNRWSGLVETDLFTEQNMKESDDDQVPGQKYENILQMKAWAVENAQKSHKLDPSEMGPIYQLIDNYFANFQYFEGMGLLATVFDSTEVSFEKRKQLIWALIWSNELDQAKRLLDWSAPKPFAKTSDFYELQAMYYDQKGDFEKSIEFYEKALETDSENNNFKYKIATLHCQNGDNNEALTWLEKALNEGFAHTQVIFFDPDLAPVVNNPKFADLSNKFNIVEYNPGNF